MLNLFIRLKNIGIYVIYYIFTIANWLIEKGKGGRDVTKYGISGI